MICRLSLSKTFAARATLGIAALWSFGCQFPAQTSAQPRITEAKPLRIASWNLSDAAAAGIITREKPKAKSWRNTFGAERRIAAKPKFAGDRLQADVILLQGVRSVKEVRQIFPARNWKLILSRDVLRLGNGRLNEETTVRSDKLITAVAVRYQLRLRVTGIEHLVDLGGSRKRTPDRETTRDSNERAVVPDSALDPALGGGGADRPSIADLGSDTSSESVPAALALRLAYSGSVIWVVSGVLPLECRTGRETCEPAARLKQWADLKRADGFGVVMGGQFENSLRQAGANSVCSDQEIITDRTLQAETGADTVAGCMVFADLEGS